MLRHPKTTIVRDMGDGLDGFKKALLLKPQQMIWGGNVQQNVIRIQARKPKLQAKGRTYGPMSELQKGRPPESEPNRRGKGPRMGFRCFYKTPPETLLGSS